MKLLPMQRKDFAGLFVAMDGFPVVTRTLDPPLHEFVPEREDLLVDLAKLPHADLKAKKEMSARDNMPVGELKKRLPALLHRVEQFHEFNLTQTAMGLSRDDYTKFSKFYEEKKIFKADPVAVLDQKGVGQLVSIAVEHGRATRKDLEVGICGEHGGEPSSVEFAAAPAWTTCPAPRTAYRSPAWPPPRPPSPKAKPPRKPTARRN